MNVCILEDVALARIELSAFLWLTAGCCFINNFIHSSPVVLFSFQDFGYCEVANALYRVSQEERSIFWDVKSIGHSKQKTLYEHVSYSERFLR